MLDYPIGQGMLKSDVVTRLFRLDPFVLQNLIALGLEFAIERRVLNQIVVVCHFARLDLRRG